MYISTGYAPPPGVRTPASTPMPMSVPGAASPNSARFVSPKPRPPPGLKNRTYDAKLREQLRQLDSLSAELAARVQEQEGVVAQPPSWLQTRSSRVLRSQIDTSAAGGALAATQDFVRSIQRRAKELGSGIAAFSELTSALDAGGIPGAELSCAEFSSRLQSYAAAHLTQHSLQESTIKAIFGAVDVDGNGALSLAELKCALATMFNLSAAEASSVMFDACDGAASGGRGDGLLQRREFTIAFRSIVAVNAMLNPEKFAHTDAHEVGVAHAVMMFESIARDAQRSSSPLDPLLQGLTKSQFSAWFVRAYDDTPPRGVTGADVEAIRAQHARELTRARQQHALELDIQLASQRASLQAESRLERDEAVHNALEVQRNDLASTPSSSFSLARSFVSTPSPYSLAPTNGIESMRPTTSVPQSAVSAYGTSWGGPPSQRGDTGGTSLDYNLPSLVTLGSSNFGSGVLPAKTAPVLAESATTTTTTTTTLPTWYPSVVLSLPNKMEESFANAPYFAAGGGANLSADSSAVQNECTPAPRNVTEAYNIYDDAPSDEEEELGGAMKQIEERGAFEITKMIATAQANVDTAVDKYRCGGGGGGDSFSTSTTNDLDDRIAAAVVGGASKGGSSIGRPQSPFKPIIGDDLDKRIAEKIVAEMMCSVGLKSMMATTEERAVAALPLPGATSSPPRAAAAASTSPRVHINRRGSIDIVQG